MAPFGGFDMPIQYEGILAEHFCTRNEAAVFDTCHMGEFSVKGPSSAADLDRIVSCDIGTLPSVNADTGLSATRAVECKTIRSPTGSANKISSWWSMPQRKMLILNG